MATLLSTISLALLVINQATAFIPVRVGFQEVSTFSTSATFKRRPTLLSSSSSSGSSSSSSEGTPSWRYEVDDLIKAASPWGSCVETETIAGDLVKRLPEIAADVSGALKQGKLLSEVVVGKGTEARSTVDGLKAVNRQLRQDILPKAFEAASPIGKAVPRPGMGTRSSSPGSSTRVNRRTGPIEGVAEALYSIKNTAKGLTPQKIRQGLQTFASETENVFSRTPSGLYSPDYSVEDAREGFEVRRYASYVVCSAAMADDAASGSETLEGNAGVTVGSGEGFNTLAGYLFGNNTQEVSMDMTTPVNIEVSPTGGRTMSFVMPKNIPVGEAPTPRDPRVDVNDVPTELLAVREFAGFATDGEVTRQLDSLLCALQLESSAPVSRWCAEDPTGKSYRLMQYNPPYTLPWQRTNAIAVRVYEDVAGDSADVVETSSQNGGGYEGRQQVSSTIMQSSGSA